MGLGAQKKVKIYMIFAVFAFYGQRTKTDFKDQACKDDCNSSRDKSFHKNSVLSNSTKMWSFTIATGSFCVPGGYLKHTQRQLVCYTYFYLWQIKTGVFLSFQASTISIFWTGWTGWTDCFIHRLLPAQKLLSPWVQVSPPYHQHNL